MSEKMGGFLTKYWPVIASIIALVFSIGVIYSNVLDNSKRVEKLERSNKKLDELSINIQFLFEKQGWKYFKIEDK